MRAAPVINRDDLAVGGRPLISARTKKTPERTSQRREKPTGCARAFRRNRVRGPGPMIAVIPALSGLGTPLGRQHAGTTQSEFPNCDSVGVLIARCLISGFEAVIVRNIGQHIAGAPVTALQASRPWNPRRR